MNQNSRSNEKHSSQRTRQGSCSRHRHNPPHPLLLLLLPSLLLLLPPASLLPLLRLLSYLFLSPILFRLRRSHHRRIWIEGKASRSRWRDSRPEQTADNARMTQQVVHAKVSALTVASVSLLASPHHVCPSSLTAVVDSTADGRNIWKWRCRGTDQRTADNQWTTTVGPTRVLTSSYIA